MDFLIEFIGEIVLEGLIEIGSSSKVPKWIRFLVLSVVVLFYVLLIGGLLFAGIKVISKDLISGLIILLIDLFLLVISIFAFKKKVSEIKLKNNQKNV